jgi:NAD(P)-dependent dehydrogenase (short-subunit alcohol dehydrogenase family)
MTRFQGQVAIVTGATSGMGQAVAKMLAREEAMLILSGRNVERGERLQNELRAFNDNVRFCAGDVALPDTNRQLVQAAIDDFGRLDLINTNAGMLGLGSVTDVPLDTWNETIATNFFSVFYLCRFAIPEMLKTGSGKVIVNASIAAQKCFPNHAAYCSSKAATVALARQMALDYGPEIRVNVICPGPVDTPLLWSSAAAFADPQSAVAAAADATLLRRLGTAEDIARLVLFLASDESSWMTGSSICLDGGLTTR